MAHLQRIPRNTSKHQPRSLRGFIILVVIVIISGGLLWSQGELVNPLPNITMLLGGASNEPGFMMVSESGTAPENADSTTVQTDAVTSETQTESAAVAETTTTTSTADGMTMETFIAELTAAGVDVDAVSATMSAEGRSLENLLTVVNSGRVTVADLALRLNGETPVSAEPPAGEGGESDSISWDALGSVAYNLWFMLAATLVVIVLTRPVNWLVNRIKHSQPAAKPA